MPSTGTLVVGVDFVFRVSTQHPFLVNSDFPVIIASRLTAP